MKIFNVAEIAGFHSNTLMIYIKYFFRNSCGLIKGANVQQLFGSLFHNKIEFNAIYLFWKPSNALESRIHI
jgi:hypothetical protein